MADSFTPTGQRSSVSYDQIEIAQLDASMRSGTNWFYWIAALSVINSILAVNSATIRFGAGLAGTQLIDAMADKVGGSAAYIGLVIDIMAAGLFAAFGFLASKRQLWAIGIGLGLYIIDALLLIGIMAVGGGFLIISVAIHGLALYGLIRGLMACYNLRKLLANQVMAPPPPVSF